MPFILNSQLSHSIMLNKSYGWIHWFEEYQQFHHMDVSVTEKSMPFEEESTHQFKSLYSHLGLTTVTVVILLFASALSFASKAF